jgi:F0F1-type ATP synthase membrane subunit b/b'
MRRLTSFLFTALCTAGVCFGQEQGGGPEDSLAFWRWINFVILAAGLGYLMAKTLPGFFESRGSAIQKEISEAQQAKRDSDQRAAAIDKRVSGLGAEIEAFRVQSRAEMEREGERIRQETAVQIRKINDQAQIEIESAGKAARREVRLYAANLALDLAAQRIRARLDPNTEAGLIGNFIGDLKRQESKN